MWFRFLVLASLVFCGVMTTLLVRSVYFPEFDRLPEVDPDHVLELFYGTPDQTHIFIYREGSDDVVGDISLTPDRNRKTDKVKISFAAAGEVELPNLPKQKLNWSGKLHLGARPDRVVEKLELRVSFSDPAVSVRMEIDPATMGFNYRVSQNGIVVSDSRTDKNAVGVMQARMLMAAWGFDPEAAAEKAGGGRWLAKQGTIEIAGHRVGAYFVVLAVPGAGEVKLTFSEAGEPLVLETPLGYEMYSEAMRTPPDPLPYNW